MAPASPTPLALSGLTGVGVRVLSSSKRGKSLVPRQRVVHERGGERLPVGAVGDLLDHRLPDALRESAVDLPLDDERG